VSKTTEASWRGPSNGRRLAGASRLPLSEVRASGLSLASFESEDSDARPRCYTEARVRPGPDVSRAARVSDSVPSRIPTGRVPPEMRQAPSLTDDDQHVRDHRLVRSAVDGDHGAIRSLVARLDCVARILASINERVTRPLPDADLEDLVQATALVVWRKLSTFEGRARLESWVYRIAYFQFMNHYRKHVRSRTLPTGDASGDLAIEAPPAPDSAVVEEIERAVEALEPPLPEIIGLKHREGLSFREIGERLELSPNSAKTYYYRGIDRLRERFASGDDEPGGSIRAGRTVR